MNYHVKTIIRNDFIKKDGTYPICLRITLERKIKVISLFKSVEEKHWDDENGTVKNSHPTADSINLLIKSYLKRATDIIFKYEVQNQVLTFDDFDKEFKKQKSENYFDFVQSIIDDNPKTNEYSHETLHTYRTELSKLKQFRAKLTFQEISISFLQLYESYMRNKLGNSVNTIHKSLRTIRCFINKAILDSIIKENVFDRYKLKSEAGKREFLTLEELAPLEALLNQPILNYLKNSTRVFLFCCYTGLRYSDVKILKYKDISNNMVVIRMHKTKQIVSIPLSNRAKALIPIQEENEFIFNVPTNQVINKFLKQAGAMAGINKKISFHCSRHTFATVGLTLGIGIETISKLLGHTNIKTTLIYAKVTDNLKMQAIEKWNALD